MTDFRGYCWLCGDAAIGARRWWDADDGWKVTRLCGACARAVTKARPQATDYACKGLDPDDTQGGQTMPWDEFTSDESEAIDALFG